MEKYNLKNLDGGPSFVKGQVSCRNNPFWKNIPYTINLINTTKYNLKDTSPLIKLLAAALKSD